MAISRAQLVKELEPGLNALFGLEYKQYANEWNEIFDTESSDRAFEEEVMLSGFANAQVKAEGQGISYDEAHKSDYEVKPIFLSKHIKDLYYKNNQPEEGNFK